MKESTVSQCVSGLTRTLNGQTEKCQVTSLLQKNDRAELDNRNYHNLCLNYMQLQSLVLLVRCTESHCQDFQAIQRPSNLYALFPESRQYIERGRGPMKLKKIDLGL